MDQETTHRQAARDSYHGQRVGDRQFNKLYDLASVMRKEVEYDGSFINPLETYSFAYSRTEKVNPQEAEQQIRGIYEGRFGESLNKTRERLLGREDFVRENQKDIALEHACKVDAYIREGDTMPYWRAMDKSASEMAQKLGITERGAQSMMKEVFRQAENQDLYEYGKMQEKLHHTPCIEMERAQRTQTQSEQPLQSRAMSRRR